MRLFAAVFRVSLINVLVVHPEVLIKMLRLCGCSLGCENGAQHVNVCSVWKYDVFQEIMHGTDEAYNRNGEMKID